jgi:outer membrane protein assembly factor BamB
VYFGTGDGQIFARNVATGIPRWAAKVGPDGVNGAHILVRSGVVVAPVLNYTVGLNATTGELLWRYEAPHDTTGRGAGAVTRPGNVVMSRIDADDATVYIPAWGASISAVDLRTGARKWVWQPGHIDGDTAVSGVFRSGSMSVRLSEGVVYATMWHNVNREGGYSEAWVVALAQLTGLELWRVKLPHQGSGVMIEGMPVVFGNLVIVNTLNARTYAIDRTTREINWDFKIAGYTVSTTSQVELYGGTIYVDGGDSHIYALRPNDGSVVWRSPISSVATTDLLVTERRITFTNGGELFVLDRQTGAQVAAAKQPRTHDPLISSPATYADGLVFVTVADYAWCFEEP